MRALVWRILVAGSRLIPGPIRRWLCKMCYCAASETGSAEHLKELLLTYGDLRDEIDRCAIRYEGGVHPKHRLMQYHSFFVDRLRSGERVLDVGCGVGAVAFSMANAGSVVTGIDFNQENIRTAQSRFRHANLRFIVGDATRDLPAGEFDSIVLSNVLEHIEHRPAFLIMLMERIKPLRLLIRVPMINRDWLVPMKKELGLPYFSDASHYVEYTDESFRAEMQEAGLKVLHLQIQWGEIWAEVSAA